MDSRINKHLYLHPVVILACVREKYTVLYKMCAINWLRTLTENGGPLCKDVNSLPLQSRVASQLPVFKAVGPHLSTHFN
jgi:hypothetical protein